MSTSARLIRRGQQIAGSTGGPAGQPPAGPVGPAPIAGSMPGAHREAPWPQRLWPSPAGAPAAVAGPPAAGRRAAVGEVAGTLPFALLLLFLLALYTRPQDLWPALRPLRLTFAFGFGAAVAYAVDALGRGAPLARPIREVFLVGALLALAAASIPFSLWPGLSARLLVDVLFKVALAFLLVSHMVDTPARLRWITGILVAAGVYLAGGAVYGLATGQLGPYAGRAGGIVGGMFKDPNDLALTLVIIIALAGFGVVASRGAAARLVLAGAIVLMLAGVFATFSRGGLVALLAAAGVGVLRLARHGRGVALGALVALALSAALLLPEGYGERAASVVTREDETGSIEARLTTLRYGVEILIENPAPGVGLGAFRIAEGVKHGGVGKWNEAHNTLLQVGAELGWPGLAVYVALAACAVANARAAARRAAGDPRLAAVAHGLETALVGFLVGAMFLSQGYTWHFYILLALTVAVRRMAEAGGVAAPPAAPRPRPDRLPATPGRHPAPHLREATVPRLGGPRPRRVG